MKILFPLFFFSVLIISCKKNTEIQKNIVAAKLYNLPNNEFREKVIPKLRNKDDRKLLIKLSKSLDQKNMSICQFIKREFELTIPVLLWQRRNILIRRCKYSL